jgi:hypothetical protein
MIDQCPRCLTKLISEQEFCPQCGEFLLLGKDVIPEEKRRAKDGKSPANMPIALAPEKNLPREANVPRRLLELSSAEQEQLTAEQKDIQARLKRAEYRIEYHWRISLIILAIAGGLVLCQLMVGVVQLALFLFVNGTLAKLD